MEGRCRFTFQPHWLLWAQECCCLCIPENNQNPDYSGLEHFRLRCREFTPLLSFRPQSDRRRREDGVEETRGSLLHHAVTRCSHGTSGYLVHWIIGTCKIYNRSAFIDQAACFASLPRIPVT